MTDRLTRPQYLCSRCGERFEPTILRELLVYTADETCPAGGGAGHQALRSRPVCESCDRTATHLSGIGNERPHRLLCPDHNQRVATDPRVWFRTFSATGS